MASARDSGKRGFGLAEDDPGFNRPVAGRSWFFGIGINEYQEFPNLNNAVKDVRDIRELLRDMYDLPDEHTFLLFDEEANGENIIDQLDQLVTAVKPDDKLIIYYSGHGHMDKNTNLGFWIPYDAKKNKTSRYLRNSTIRDYIKVIKARHILLISDSCFSGSFFARGGSRSTAAVEDLEIRPSRWAICSGRADEEVYDGEPGTNSPFATSIMDTLRTNRLKYINVAKLADQVVLQTRNNYEQLPEGNPLYGVGDKGGQYIFWQKALEGDDWQQAERAASLLGYKLFLERHPDGKYSAQAREKIAYLEETVLWEKAKEENTIMAYFEYDQQYPNGRYARQAMLAIKELEENNAWEKALSRDSLYAFKKYLMDYPDGKHREKATTRLQAIVQREKEARQWRQSSLEDDIKPKPESKEQKPPITKKETKEPSGARTTKQPFVQRDPPVQKSNKPDTKSSGVVGTAGKKGDLSQGEIPWAKVFIVVLLFAGLQIVFMLIPYWGSEESYETQALIRGVLMSTLQGGILGLVIRNVYPILEIKQVWQIALGWVLVSLLFHLFS